MATFAILSYLTAVLLFAFPAAVVLYFLIYGLLRARSWVCWIGFATLPLVAFAANDYNHQSARRARAELVQNLPRMYLSGSHPPVLTVYGYMAEIEISLLLQLHGFDAAYQLELRSDTRHEPLYYQGKLYTASGGPECQQAARAWQKSGSHLRRDAVPERCIKYESIKIFEQDLPANSIVFRMEQHVTFKRSNPRLEAYEVRLKTPESSLLVDYWEVPELVEHFSPICLPGTQMCKQQNGPDRKSRFGFLTSALTAQP